MGWWGPRVAVLVFGSSGFIWRRRVWVRAVLVSVPGQSGVCRRRTRDHRWSDARHESRGLGRRDLSPAPSPSARKKLNAHLHELARNMRNTKTDVPGRDSSSVGTRQPKLKSWFFDRDYKLRLNTNF
ncbi:hypothetical protein BHE74_00020305 [Ensete ventricosum]|uniref:Uncharacterized protein n=1 Tax=Ensete ventricosum TaxID=4639 RepID=A0A445MBK1_ENSVE|nr:hypothetical protein BHE74_00020305 [Ensete ventricosum]RZR71599.1 hypothetical protein BHM03_00005998 [Ensete ventricosum]